ncbi:MAG: hypothetical protein V4665_03190 [Patescibacteria group bacterium]
MESFGKNINPTKTSFLERVEGETFTEIKEFPQRQFLLSSLVRGIIPAAQIIVENQVDEKGEVISRKYFSHHQKIDSLEKRVDPDHAWLEFEADKFVLDQVFQSRDHDVFDEKKRQKDPKNQREHMNVITNVLEEDKDKYFIRGFDKYTLFDFGKSFIPHDAVRWENDHDSISIPKRREMFIRNIVTLYQMSPWSDDPKRLAEVLSLIKNKSDELLQTTLKDSSAFMTILEKGAVDLNKKEFEVYFEGNFIEQTPSDQQQRAELMFKEIKDRAQLLSDTAGKVKDTLERSAEAA